MTDDRRCRRCRFWTPSDPGHRDGWDECRLTAADADSEAGAPTSLTVAVGEPARPRPRPRGA